MFIKSTKDNDSNPLTRITANGDILLANTMPQAEYMYGCTPTAVAMLLGFYDMYGYRGKNYSDLIAGVVAQNSRGTDGNKYDMDAFDTVLGLATASKDYVYRFYSRGDLDIITGNKSGSYWTTSGEEELEYSFTSGGEGPELRTDNWNCIADYLGTGQCWRGNDNLSTSFSVMSLEEAINTNSVITYISDETTRTIDWRYTTMIYGLYLYVRDKGYALDTKSTGIYAVDVNNGSFTFEDYMMEIDAGRPVLISITEHSMVGYGYNAETREIIFDDCYEADQRMVWGGTYYYSGAYRHLETITVVRFMNGDDINLALTALGSESDGAILTLADGNPVNESCFEADTLFVSFTISNLGSTDCEPFPITIYVDGQPAKTFSNVYIEANSSRDFINVPLGELCVGLHIVRVIADEGNAGSELSNLNNVAEQKVMILKDGTNIVSGLKTVSSGKISFDDYVTSDGQFHVLNGGTASGTLVWGKVADISSDGITTFQPGTAIVSQGGLIRDVSVYEYGQLLVEGTAENVRVYEDGVTVISAGGYADGLCVGSDATVRIESGGILSGIVSVAKGASVVFEDGGILLFDLSDALPGSDATINGLSYILGNYSCALTVDASLPRGQYKLATDAGSFSGTITVSDTSGILLGSIVSNAPLVTESGLYSLKCSQGTLLLNIKAVHPEKPVASADITEPTSGEVRVSATFSEDSFLKEYSLDGIQWFNYTSPIKLTQNGTVLFRAINEEGFASEIASCTVENIDKSFVSGLTLNKGESAFVYSGQTYFKTVLSGGQLYVREEGLVDSASIESGGNLFICSGGTAICPVVASGGSLDVMSGGTAMGVIWSPCVGTIQIDHGAEITFADSFSGVYYGSGGQLLSHAPVFESQTVSRASMYAMSGGTANCAEIGFSGYLFAFGGMANDTEIYSGGYCCASCGGELNNTTVNSGGRLIVSSGGMASGIVENGGYVNVRDGGTASFAAHTFSGSIVHSSATVHSGTTANSTTMNSGCLFVYSGGKLTGRTICLDGIVSTYQGAVVDFDLTEVTPDAAARINDFSKIMGEAPIYVITVNPTQEQGLYRLADKVSDFNSTISVMNMNGVELTTISVGESKSIAGIDCALLLSDNTLSLKFGTDDSSIPATSNGLVLKKGSRTVASGELFRDTVIDSGGVLYIADCGIADSAAVNSGGTLYISSGGRVKTLMVNSGGVVYVLSGGSALRVRENGGLVDIKDGAEEDVTFLPNTFSNHVQALKKASLHSGTTTFSMTVMYNGAIRIFNGGQADRTIISSGGIVSVCSGGLAKETTVSSGGVLYISSGGLGDCIFVASSGSLYAKENSRITGRMTVEAGAVFSANETTVLDFDLTRMEPGAAALVNNLSVIQGMPLYTLTVDSSLKTGTYVYNLADGALNFNGMISVVNTAGAVFGTLSVGQSIRIGETNYSLNLTGSLLSVSVNSPPPPSPVNLNGTQDHLSWDPNGAKEYIVECSADDFEHAFRAVVSSPATDLREFPAGTYQWRVKGDGSDEWTNGNDIVFLAPSEETKVVQSKENGNDDIFFATVVDTWNKGFCAKHSGTKNDWAGTKETVPLNRLGRIRNLFFGSSDPNVLCLTDADNGDAIFVDDVYTDSPEDMAKETARLYKIQEIRAGAGADIVDMTSQRFEYNGDGLTIRGGAGDDTIWANRGDNFLFGDDGNDRIVGASGNDVITGGIGNDRMHGGGGNDVFTFCDNWGADNVEQLADGKVTLWFASGSETNWDSTSLTYTDGANSVKVTGVASVELKFGDDGSDLYATLTSSGAFAKYSSQRIFEETGKGIMHTALLSN